MRKKLLSTVVAGLFVSTPSFAQTADDPMRIQGSATIGYINTDQSAQDTTKLEEYQDLSTGALSNVSVRGRNSRIWVDGYGENFGRSDQYMFLNGGMYDVFKAGAYLNEMPHNFNTSARTPYSGTGSNTLVTTFPRLDPGIWNTFNQGYERRDAGGHFEWQKNNPWYFRVDGSSVTFDGTKVGSAANGTSPGNGFVDLAFPVQYRTTNWGVEGGYQSAKATLALRWDYSKFDDSNDILYWTNPYFGFGTAQANQLDATYLPPDNTFNKFTVTGNYRDLPWKSVISARYTWARTTSNVTLGENALNSSPTNPSYPSTLPSEGNFNGEHINQSLALAWTAVPITNVDTRVYYYWTKLDNESDVVEYGHAPAQQLASGLGCGNVTVAGIPQTGTVGNCDNELFSYRKNNIGFDAWWRFAKGQRLGFGYDYLDLDQERFDYSGMHWNKFFVEYKNTMLDTLSGRLKYQYLKRDSDSNLSDAGIDPNDPNYLLRFTSAFDMQSSTSNQVKLNLDWTPMPLLGLSFEANWIDTDFDDVTYGRTSADRQGYFLSANWGDPNKFLLSAFGSWEEVKYPSGHRAISTISNGSGTGVNTLPNGWCQNTNLNCFSPTAAPTSGSYNWNSRTKDETWMVGVGADWPISQQWLLKASYLYVKADGEATFASQDGTGAMVGAPNGYGNPLNIGNFDDSTWQSFNVKAIYSYNKNLSFTAGYAYEKYEQSDIATDGYQYLLPITNATPTNNSLSYLNGYGAFTNGHQNIFYILATYKFDAPPLPPAKMPAPPAPAPLAQAPKPPPPPAPTPPPAPAPQVQRITLDSKVLFDFDKAVLRPEGRAAIDSQVVGRLSQIQKLEVVLVTGHTDRIGSEAYNQKLSERRADAVRDYLVSKGVPRDRIETIGMGEKQPVVQCDQQAFKALVECLQPNRRVEVQVKGETTK